MGVSGEEVRFWFEQAVGVPAATRLAFLEAQCPDAKIRGEVLSLLEFDTGEFALASGPAVHGIVKDTIGSVLRNWNATAPANRVGPFEVGKLLGSGGMGFVYEAHRVDGEVRQRVAVKFAQVSPAASEKFRESVHRRFCRERQVLASLRHPYIAGLIDAGTTGDGIPYAVIEQVDGVPVDAYCDERLPDQADRIRLILKLCEAVQFAHRNLIVHSDIKPDNVLVTPDGIPKLIDFGVANDLTEEASITTMRAFTPGYASPEQLRGQPATVATDVYGLGAVLYRLLTGTKPRQMKSTSGTELIRMREQDIPRPSSVRPELKGDLENILLKALQEEPHRRYGSVPELADDLNRFLARRPVRASPDSTVYRARRFVRRHWVLLTATVALVAALATTTLVAVRQREQAIRRALETRRLAETLLFEVHDEIGGLVGGTKAREKLGAVAVGYLEGLRRDYGRDPELAWELLNAYSRLGQSRGGAASSVGDTKSGVHFALKTLELGAIVERAAPGSDRLDRLFAVYESLVPIFEEAGRRAQRREAVDRMMRLAPGLAPIREAQALKERARYLAASGSVPEAVDAFERAAGTLRKLSRSESKPSGCDSQLISTLAGLGRAQAVTGNFTGAVVSLQEAIRLSESNTAADPHIARNARQLYWSHIMLGDVLGLPARFNLGRPREAAEHYGKAASVAEKLVAADAGNEMAKVDLARALGRQGVSLAATDPARALALMERSQSTAIQTSTRNHSGLDARLMYLTSSVGPLVQLGYVERARRNVSEARSLLTEMRLAGIPIDENVVLKAAAIQLYASGQPRDALQAAQDQLARLPEKTSPVLSENFEAVEALERMRVYAAGSDPSACTTASDRLARIWNELRASHPHSAFVRTQFERMQTTNRNRCTAGAPATEVIQAARHSSTAARLLRR
jgi:tetratricopeptide (TPR) repeat protein